MPGKENLALLLAHSLFPLSLEDLKKLFPGGLVYSLWITTFNFNVFVFCEIEIIMEQDDNAPRHLKQFFFWWKKSEKFRSSVLQGQEIKGLY